MTEPILYKWPESAKFDRNVPKNKFYENGVVTAATREKFVSEVKRIRWAYKLAESTLNIPATVEVLEIQVFSIDAKSEDVSDDVLATIDKAVKLPIIFEINRENVGVRETRMTACHKRLGSGKPQLSAYFSSTWADASTDRIALPAAIDMGSIQQLLIAPLLPVAARADERLLETTERIALNQKIERQIAALERKLRNEPQFNRKVELRRQLNGLARELGDTVGPESIRSEQIVEKETEWTN